MILTLEYENLRHGSRKFNFSERNWLLGPNASGKSTIADAIAFAFTGSDSQGNPLPIHLIQEGKDRLFVRIDTGKVVLERTLTQKKNQTIKLTSNGMPPNTITQADLTSMTCSREAFLSAFMAGYFMSLPADKRAKVFSEFAPSVNRVEVLRSFYNGLLPEAIGSLLSSPRELRHIKQTVSQSALGVRKQIDQLDGAISQLNSVQKPSEEKAHLPEDLNTLYARKAAWDRYNSSLSEWKKKYLSIEQKKVTNSEIDEELSALHDQLQSIQVPDLPVRMDYTSDIRKLEEQKKSIPSEPHYLRIPDSDSCPTCGQTVGLKHRDAVRKNEEDLKEKWKELAKDVYDHNITIGKEISRLRTLQEEFDKSYWVVENQRQRTLTQRQELEKKISKFVKHTDIEAGPAPEKPSVDPISDEEFKNKQHEFERVIQYNSAVDSRVAQYNQAQSMVYSHNEKREVYVRQANELNDLLDALSKLDEAILKHNSASWGLNNDYMFTVADEEVSVQDNTGKPYSVMSTGEKIRADAYICEKIANNLPRTVKFVFVDNADLVSNPLNINVEQVFYAVVDDGNFRVKNSEGYSYPVEDL